jgi:multidrug efflux system membrane fusion protein
LDRDNRTILDEGKLAVIDNQIDTTTGTIRLKGTFPNPGLKLWPGQFINARLLLSVRTNGIVVPASVVQRGPEGPYAFVVKGDMTVEMVKVKVAEIDQGLALIDSGLTPGQRVVVDGQYKLQLGSKVKPAGMPGADQRQTNLAPGSSRAPGSGKSARSASEASR